MERGARTAARGLAGAAVGAVAVVVLAAYGGVLGNFFHEIDDATHLWAASTGRYPSSHFRPLHFVWNRALLGAFGAEPAGWYATGLAVHAAGALLAGALVLGVTGVPRAGAVAALAFAAFYSPHEAVLWISASGGLLSVTALLGSAVAWVRFLRRGGGHLYALALVLGAAAMGFKEDGVLVVPLLVGVHVAMGGWRSVLRREALARYLPFLSLAALHLAVALRPAHWSEMPNVGEYALRASLAERLLANFAVLFWPRNVERIPELAVVAGGALLVVLAAVAVRGGRPGRWTGLGTLLAVAGLLPVLPGPDAIPIAGTRYAYPSAIGVAFLAAGIFELGWRLADRAGTARVLRPALVAGFGLWIGVQVLSIRSVERWRYEARCDRLEGLLRSTRLALEEHSGAGSLAVVAPDVWNANDYHSSLLVFCGFAPREVRLEYAPLDSLLGERLRRGGDLDPAARPVLTQLGGAAGPMELLTSVEAAPRERWTEVAEHQSRLGLGRSLPVVWIDPGPARSAGDRRDGGARVAGDEPGG